MGRTPKGFGKRGRPSKAAVEALRAATPARRARPDVAPPPPAAPVSLAAAPVEVVSLAEDRTPPAARQGSAPAAPPASEPLAPAPSPALPAAPAEVTNPLAGTAGAPAAGSAAPAGAPLPLTIAPPEVAPHLDPVKVAALAPLAGTLLAGYIEKQCAARRKQEPGLADFEAAKIPEKGAAAALAWFPVLGNMSGKVTAPVDLWLSINRLIDKQPDLPEMLDEAPPVMERSEAMPPAAGQGQQFATPPTME